VINLARANSANRLFADSDPCMLICGFECICITPRNVLSLGSNTAVVLGVGVLFGRLAPDPFGLLVLFQMCCIGSIAAGDRYTCRSIIDGWLCQSSTSHTELCFLFTN